MIRLKWTRIVLAGVAAATLSGSAAFAQQGTAEQGKRKVKTRVSAVYPDLARRMNVTGKVKIEIVIAPDGRVKSARVIGGHPLLIRPSVLAVKEWKFFPAAAETTQMVEFEFRGTEQ